ncbi:plasmid segregation oscillating ATPase ParF [Chryseobacterium sp. CBTAP 102]|uniref:ParA family protein n=1 Tax=Chryseobacterium sp. CBTAP 102 TaxID=2135644 RepID=UPI000D76D3EB|nr:ParA family protein [Chryseobacterium sp. CBTAP 102]PXW06474.1 plasmid segregation oscillating ATPase ParF [Chryseobacterium sp. CBTAP 102]
MKIISVIHQKGGVGKSTLTFNIACNLKDSANVEIVDMDYQGSLLKIRGISDVPIHTADKLDELIKKDLDFLFIDTPPYLSENLPKLIKMSDAIIIPTKAGFFDFLAIESTIDLIKQTGGEDKSMIVFNMVKPNTTLTSEIKEKLTEYEIKVADTKVSDLVAITRSGLVNGVEDSENAQNQINELTEEIINFSFKMN